MEPGLQAANNKMLKHTATIPLEIGYLVCFHISSACHIATAALLETFGLGLGLQFESLLRPENLKKPVLAVALGAINTARPLCWLDYNTGVWLGQSYGSDF
jgi:hypothetical protein